MNQQTFTLPKSNERIILIDGSAIAYRSYFAFIKNPLRNSRGENTGAIFGVANSLLKILKEQKFSHIVACFDTQKPTFRHKIFKEYKATRQKMDNELKIQIPDIKLLIEAMGIYLIEVEGFEADDVIGTLAKRALQKGFSVTLVSFDKDFFQLLTEDGIDILKPAKGKISEEVITAEVVKRKLGIAPEQMIDYLALIGDISDNVPGIQGVGPKTAVKLLKDFGNVESIVMNRSKLKSQRIASAIDDGKLQLSKKLVTIDTNLSIELDLDSLVYNGKKEAELRKIFNRFEFTSLMGRLGEDRENVAEFRDYDSEGIEQIIKNITESAAIEFLNIDGSSFFSIANSNQVYVSDSLNSRGDDCKKLYPIFNKSRTLKISSDVKSLLHFIAAETLDTTVGFFDLSVASYLLDPSRGNHTIDFISLRYGNRMLKKRIELCKSFKKEKVTEKEVREELSKYAQTDISIYPKLKRRLEEEGVDKLFYSLEMPLVSVLARMERSGILIDKKFFNVLGKSYEKQIGNIEKNVYNIAGETFNIRSTKQLQNILFSKLKLHPPRRTKTGFSTDSETLLLLSEKHDLPKEILKYRELYKLKSTYIDALPSLTDATGRIHTTFIQTTTSTGRLASRNPNLQNIPVRGILGREIRKGFIAPRHKKLLSCDYSQVELRILAHISGDQNLKYGFHHNLDIHTKTASNIFRIPEKDITKEMRRRAKVINFGIIYGMSPYGLAQELNITPEEGMVIINSYFNTYPGVKRWIDTIIEETKQKGIAETILGRKRRIPEIKSKDYNTREFGKRIAINTPVQGSAADIIKVAMVRLDERIRKESIDALMVLQIHDELLFEVDESSIDKVSKIIVNEMENAFPLSVPLKVDVGVGDNWYDAH